MTEFRLWAFPMGQIKRIIFNLAWVLPLILIATACGGSAGTSNKDKDPSTELTPEELLEQFFQENKDCNKHEQGALQQQATDMLFVIDNSGSMADDQAALAAAATGFGNALADAITMDNLDVHFGVTTTNTKEPSETNPAIEDGAFFVPSGYSEPFLKSDSADLATAISEYIVVGTPSGVGAGFEAGSIAAMRAVDPDYVNNQPGGQNVGFLRDDSFLSVFVLSDENDDSRNDPYFETPENVQAFFDDLKGANNWLFSSVIHTDDTALDPVASWCYNNGEDEVGAFYQTLVNLTGGVLGSLCNGGTGGSSPEPNPDFEFVLDSIFQASIDLTKFWILTSEDPIDESTIRLYVDDVQNYDWEYKPAAMKLIPDAGSAALQEGAKVEICWLPQGLLEE